MESKEPIILNPEDFQDYHKLARKIFGASPKGGRPTKEESEFKEYLKDLYQFRLAKESGLLDAFMGNLGQSEERTTRDRTGDSGGLFEGILKGDFEIAGLFTEEVLQETIKSGVVRYGPLIGALIAIWIAESTIKLPAGKNEDGSVRLEPIPQVLHTLYTILQVITLLTQQVTGFIKGITEFDLLEGLGDAIKKTPESKVFTKHTDAAAEKLANNDAIGAAIELALASLSGLPLGRLF